MKIETIQDLLSNIHKIYQVPDDRLYSVDDLIYNHQHFFDLFQKDLKKSKFSIHLDVSLAWFLAFINRFHIDLEKLVWIRYSYKCPFCLEIPCFCKNKKVKSLKTGRPASIKPETLDDWQQMISKIYPDDKIKQLENYFLDNLSQLNFYLRKFIREKRKSQFVKIEKISTDHFVIIFRIYNCLKLNLSNKFNKLFKNGCYVCHQIPCECNYFE